MKIYRPQFELGEYRRPTPHFKVAVGSNRLCYAYIPKNACSAFKQMLGERRHFKFIIESAISKAPGGQFDIGGNLRHFKVSRRRVERPDSPMTNVFVYRDPLERVISVFINKFIDTGFSDIITNKVQNALGADINDVTYRKFLTYLEADFDKVDAHLVPQKAHLFEAEYIPLKMSELQQQMAALIGEQSSAQYFGKKRNASHSDTGATLEPSHDIQIGDLRKMRQEGQRFSKQNFMDPDLDAFILSRYRQDVDAISLIEAEREQPSEVSLGL